jgi:ABC-2 type transport system ATP-binding protein
MTSTIQTPSPRAAAAMRHGGPRDASGTIPIVEAQGLVVRFGRRSDAVVALDGLELSAPAGSVTAVLGPNGAGKTTFVRCVATLQRFEAGTLRVAGVDVAAEPHTVRQAIGLAGQFAAVDAALSGRENLTMVARMFGHDRRGAARAADVVLEQLGLTEAGRRLVRTYSGGMRRRLDLGSSLVGAPRLLLLDEPTTGLDPASRADLWDAIRTLVAAGTEVVLTTQYLEEADQLADHVVIIDHGKAVAAGTPDELKQRTGQGRIEVRARDGADVDDAAAVLRRLGDDVVVDHPTRRVSVASDGGTDRLAEAMTELATHRVALDDIGLRRPTLDEVFLAITGQPTSTDTDAGADQHVA